MVKIKFLVKDKQIYRTNTKMKKLIKIFAFPSHSPGKHTSGVDYPRVIQPMKFLNGYKDKDVKFQVDLWDGKSISMKDWYEKVQNYDIVYFNYMINDAAYVPMRIATEILKKKLVMDIDDAVWRMNPDNTVYNLYEKGSRGLGVITEICSQVDYMTCTNSYLRNIIVDNTRKRYEQVKIFPNCVDLNLYKDTPEFKNTPFINIVHYGSSSHYTDLNDPEFIKGIEKIMYEYPNVTFLTVGSFFGDFKMKWGKRYEEEFGATNFLDWANNRFPEVMAKTDIFVAPLTIESVYNRSKSNIKWEEVSTAKKVGCWADIRQYQEVVESGKNGFLCRRAEDWYKNIKYLIDNPEERKKMGESAFDDVKRDWTIQTHIPDYAEFFKEILTS